MTLTIDDFIRPELKGLIPSIKKIPARANQRRKEEVIAGVTFTDSFHRIGFQYFTSDGMLHLDYWDTEKRKQVMLVKKPITTVHDYERYISEADRKIHKYHN